MLGRMRAVSPASSSRSKSAGVCSISAPGRSGSVEARFTTTTRSTDSRARKARMSDWMRCTIARRPSSWRETGLVTSPSMASPQFTEVPGLSASEMSSRSFLSCCRSSMSSDRLWRAMSQAESQKFERRTSWPPKTMSWSGTRSSEANSGLPVMSPVSGDRPRAMARVPTTSVVPMPPSAPTVQTPSGSATADRAPGRVGPGPSGAPEPSRRILRTAGSATQASYGLVPAAPEFHDSRVSYEPHRFEDFAPGQAYEFGKRRITREDIAAFADVSDDHTALHCDDDYAATTPFGSVVSHGALNVAAATGLAYRCGLFEGTVLAVLSLESRFERPVFPGDELSLRMTVKEVDARPRPDRGRVTFQVELVNQAGKKVLTGDWTL